MKAAPAEGWSAGIRAGAVVPVLIVNAHGEQNGAIYQEVTLGRGNVSPVSLLAEHRAGVLECLINSKHRNHSSHLHSYEYRLGCRAGAGALVLTAYGPLLARAGATRALSAIARQ